MKLIIDVPKEDYKEVLKDTYSGTSFENRIFTAIANGIPLDKIRNEIEQNIGDNPYKNDGIYCSLHVLDNYMMPCVTKKELQHCREVVKKYTPKDNVQDFQIYKAKEDKRNKQMLWKCGARRFKFK